jgi:hypothetical protein
MTDCLSQVSAEKQLYSDQKGSYNAYIVYEVLTTKCGRASTIMLMHRERILYRRL